MAGHIKVLIVAFLILAGIVFFVANPLNRDEASDERPLFSFSEDDVASFRINNFTQGLLFHNDGGTWTVKRVKTELAEELESKDNGVKLADEDAEAVKADPVKVGGVLTHLATVRAGEPIASEKNSQNLFQINEHSLHVVLSAKNGAELGRLYVGKNGPDMMSSFVKRGRENDVYLVDVNLQGLLAMPFDQWKFKDETAPPGSSSGAGSDVQNEQPKDKIENGKKDR